MPGKTPPLRDLWDSLGIVLCRSHLVASLVAAQKRDQGYTVRMRECGADKPGQIGYGFKRVVERVRHA